MNKEEMIAKALMTKEGKKTMFEAISKGVILFRDKYFSKWDRDHQDRFLKVAFGSVR